MHQVDKHHVGRLGRCLGIQYEANSNIIPFKVECTFEMYLGQGPRYTEISLICATFVTMAPALEGEKSDAERDVHSKFFGTS